MITFFKRTKLLAALVVTSVFVPVVSQAQEFFANYSRLQPMQPHWVKVCGRDERSGLETCYTTRDFGYESSSEPVLALAVYSNQKDPSYGYLRLLVSGGIAPSADIQVKIDEGLTLTAHLKECISEGCLFHAELGAAKLDELKKGISLRITSNTWTGKNGTFILPLQHFGKAFDGTQTQRVIYYDSLPGKEEVVALRKILEDRATIEKQNSR
jgi:invasion protein IalB